MTPGTSTYLPAGLPAPTPAGDGLDAEYWAGTARGELIVQRCSACSRYQWGPEWICHRCRSFALEWAPVAPHGLIYSWERIWHPVHPAVAEACPYVVVLVELPHADGIRMVGNLLADPTAPVPIGAPVEAVFEHHADAAPQYSLVQWKLV